MLTRALATLLLLLHSAAPARAAKDLPCTPAEGISIDGLLDDWTNAAGMGATASGSKMSFTATCAYDARALYFAVDVQDDYLVRTPAARPDEDHVELLIVDKSKKAVERLLVYPEDGKSKRKVVWSSGRPTRGILVAESRQPRGWSIELALPLAMMPEWSAGVPLVHAAIAVSDTSSKTNPVKQGFATTAESDGVAGLNAIHFAEAASAFDALLKDLHLTQKDVRQDQVGRVTPKGKGRVVVIGKYLAIISDEYAYIELPIAAPGDLQDVKLLDLAGDGRDAILVRYVEKGGGGEREVLASYRMTSDGLRRVFGVETAKRAGGNALATKVEMAKPKKGKGLDITVEAQPATGWSEATYHEAPAEDLVAIPLPWAKSKRARFHFSGDGYQQLE